ncbi:hypothetical protein M231_03851 [Tremella mesenterica]|uniref:DUF952 domain-containing protein n=1 Tax=Tremella mesenterica TaxID=5217 RepID=A0A4Q1BML9_TREME|nr:hypothetical protein M231_03851 [Tremella mesenterica]
MTLPQLDHDDGFVHTSSGPQVLDTLELFFKDVPQIWLLRMDVGRLSAWRKIEWLPGSGQTSTQTAPRHICAHLHRPWLKGEEIDSFISVAQGKGGWEVALSDRKVKEWLV